MIYFSYNNCNLKVYKTLENIGKTFNGQHIGGFIWLLKWHFDIQKLKCMCLNEGNRAVGSNSCFNREKKCDPWNIMSDKETNFMVAVKDPVNDWPLTLELSEVRFAHRVGVFTPDIFKNITLTCGILADVKFS